MASKNPQNALVMQSGGCTPGLNQSLSGVAATAAASKYISTVYGSIHGLEGIIEGQFVDLTALSDRKWNKIRRAPGAALGSTRRKFLTEDAPRVISVFSEWDIR